MLNNKLDIVYNSIMRKYVQDRGKLQLSFLQEYGLLPHHFLLDIGCARLWGGQFFIPYLNKHRYYGTDKELSVIKTAKMLIDNISIFNDKYPVVLLNNNGVLDLDIIFDFGIASSVFNHNTINVLKQYLINLRGKVNNFFFDVNISNIDYSYINSDLVTMFTYETLYRNVEGICNLNTIDGRWGKKKFNISRFSGVDWIKRQIFKVTWL